MSRKKMVLTIVKIILKITLLALSMCLLSIVHISCSTENAETQSKSESEVWAKNVHLEFPVDGGSLKASGDFLSIKNQGEKITIKGNTAVIFEGNSKMNASADKIEIDRSKLIVDMSGKVMVTFPGPNIKGINVDSGL